MSHQLNVATSLRPKQRVALDILDQTPGWRWSKCFDANWRENIKRLKQVAAQHGLYRMSSRFKSTSGAPLSQWLSTMRVRLKKGMLSAAKQRELLAIKGFHLDVEREQCRKRLQELQAYVHRYGVFPADHGATPLGRWVTTVKLRFRRRKLPQWVADELERLPGWIWNKPDKMILTLNALIDKAAKYPDDWFSQKRLSGSESQMLWKYRVAFRQGLLPRRIRLALQRLPNWSWDTRKDAWLSRYRKAAVLFKRFGGFPVLRADAVSVWIGVQLMHARAGKLDKWRHSLLAQLPGWTLDKRPRAQAAVGAAHGTWLASFRRLQERLRHVPLSAIEPDASCRDYRFIWKARLRKRKGLLDKLTIKKLESLPGWSWEPPDQRSAELFERLRRALLQTPIAKLGGWERRYITRIKRQKRLGKLPASWIARFATLPGWTWETKRPPKGRDVDNKLWRHGFDWLATCLRTTPLAQLVHTGKHSREGRFIWAASRAYRNKTLSRSAVKLLEGLPGWKWPVPRWSSGAMSLSMMSRA